MGNRRKFIKQISVAIGACIVRPVAAFGRPVPAARSVGIYLGRFGREHPVVCAILATNVAGVRQSVRRTRRKHLTGLSLAAGAEITPLGSSRPLKRYLYRQLAGLEPKVHKGIEVFEVHVNDGAAWKGREARLYAQMVRALLKSSRLVRFGEVSVYADSRIPNARPTLIAIGKELEKRLPSVKRFDVFPDNAKKHDGVQAARFVAYAFSQKHSSGDSEGYDLLSPMIRGELDLSGKL